MDISGVVEYEAGSIGTVKIKRRIDALYGSQVIEFKSYNLLSNPREQKKALSQVSEKYLAALTEEKRSFFRAVIFDGMNIVTVCYDVDNKSWKHEMRLFSEAALYDWLLLLLGAIKKQVSATKLKNDFVCSIP